MLYSRDSTDAELILGCCNQHRLAQQYLYERYYGQLIGIPIRYCGNREEAVEVLNMAFLKIFDAIGQYQQIGSFGGWTARIVFHTTIDYVRARLAHRRHYTDQPLPEQATDNHAIQQLMAEDLYQLICLLPATERTVFNLFVIDGYRHKEIGEMLHFDEGTSRWYLAQARRHLQELVKAHYPSVYQYQSA